VCARLRRARVCGGCGCGYIRLAARCAVAARWLQKFQNLKNLKNLKIPKSRSDLRFNYYTGREAVSRAPTARVCIYEMQVYNHCYRLVINKHSYTRKYRVKHGRKPDIRRMENSNENMGSH